MKISRCITKDGNQYKVSAQHFAQIIEQEKQLSPDDSDIRICKNDGSYCEKCHAWFCGSGTCDLNYGANECYLYHNCFKQFPEQ